MTLRWIWITLLLTSACAAPGVDMRGATKTRVTIEQSQFDVFVLGTKARAVRVNFETGRKARGIMARGFQAIERGSGCAIVPGTYQGDPAVMVASIYCDGEA